MRTNDGAPPPNRDAEARAAAGDLAAQLELADLCDAAGNTEEATRWLGAAARQGSLVAIAQLGARTFVGAGCARNASDGKALLEFAASRGSGLALRHLSVLALSGFDGAPHVGRALGLAAAAAEAGEDRARAELDALLGRVGDWDDPREIAEAEGKAAALLAEPRSVALSDDPPIARLPSLASPALRAWLRDWCEPVLARAGTIDRASGEFRVEAARTNRFARIGFFDQPLELQWLKLRLAEVVGEPVTHFEGTNVLAYEPGERFDVHHDYLDPAEPGFAAELATDGQRVATVLVALNAGYEGGETCFPDLGIRWRGEPGEGLCFRNADPAGEPDRRTLHAGEPPESGRKWILSQWVRSRPQAPG